MALMYKQDKCDAISALKKVFFFTDIFLGFPSIVQCCTQYSKLDQKYYLAVLKLAG